MNLNDLQPAPGSTKRRKRVGRGIGSGRGKTSTRGSKGQKARRQIPAYMEGGQTPIHRRLPHKKGFRNVNHIEHAIVNLATLDQHFEAGAEVTPQVLIDKGIIGGLKDGVKILAFGELTKKMVVHAHAFSKVALEKIAQAGGEAVTIVKKAKAVAAEEAPVQ